MFGADCALHPNITSRHNKMEKHSNWHLTVYFEHAIDWTNDDHFTTSVFVSNMDSRYYK